MSKQTALEIAERDGVKMNTIYMRRLRERRRLEKEKAEFSAAWKLLAGKIRAAGPSQAAWIVWCAARGITEDVPQLGRSQHNDE